MIWPARIPSDTHLGGFGENPTRLVGNGYRTQRFRVEASATFRVTAERRHTLMKGSDEVPEKVRVTHGREGAGRAGARSFWLTSPGREARVARGWSGRLGGAGESPGVAWGQMETEMVA